jgi:hypothetical protein
LANLHLGELIMILGLRAKRMPVCLGYNGTFGEGADRMVVVVVVVMMVMGLSLVSARTC